jgi:uncharacterized protein
VASEASEHDRTLPSRGVGARLARYTGRSVAPAVRSSAITPDPNSALAELPDAIQVKLSRPLAERLARLQPHRRLERTTERPSDLDIAARVGGRVLGPQLIRIDRTIALPARHGNVRLDPLTTTNGVLDAAAAARLSIPADIDPARVVFFDTETSGLAGGTGTVAFVIGVMRWIGNQIQLSQLLLLGFSAEEACLAALTELIGDAQLLVSYNGKTFDAPLLRTRYRLHRGEDPLAAIAHLDLLHWVRRKRPKDWPDARLATVESRWMGLARTNDIGGAEIPAAWQRWLQTGQADAFAGILAHNRTDLVTLAAVMNAALVDHPNDLLTPTLVSAIDAVELNPPPKTSMQMSWLERVERLNRRSQLPEALQSRC